MGGKIIYIGRFQPFNRAHEYRAKYLEDLYGEKPLIAVVTFFKKGRELLSRDNPLNYEDVKEIINCYGYETYQFQIHLDDLRKTLNSLMELKKLYKYIFVGNILEMILAILTDFLRVKYVPQIENIHPSKIRELAYNGKFEEIGKYVSPKCEEIIVSKLKEKSSLEYPYSIKLLNLKIPIKN